MYCTCIPNILILSRILLFCTYLISKEKYLYFKSSIDPVRLLTYVITDFITEMIREEEMSMKICGLMNISVRRAGLRITDQTMMEPWCNGMFKGNRKYIVELIL